MNYKRDVFRQTYGFLRLRSYDSQCLPEEKTKFEALKSKIDNVQVGNILRFKHGTKLGPCRGIIEMLDDEVGGCIVQQINKYNHKSHITIDVDINDIIGVEIE